MKKFLCITAFAALSLCAMSQSKAQALLDKISERFAFRGYAQLGWEYHDMSDPNNEFKLNKLIIMGDLRITDKWNAFAMFDFKGFTLQELWTNYQVQPWLNIKVGQFKTPFTIENPLSPTILETISQPSMATSYFVMGSGLMMPKGAGRDIGLTVYGNVGKYVSYDLAVMNGAGRSKSDDNSWKDFVGRLTFHPLKCLDVSASTILGKGASISLDEDGSYLVWRDKVMEKNYTRNRFAVGAYLKTKPVDLRAEWMWGKDGEFKSNGGYATTQVKDIGVKGLDLIASFDHLENTLTTNRYQAGVQYWFYKKCRVQASYSYTKVKGLVGDNGILTQIQVGF
ncbi:MAG: hypothetical protein II677_04740 [Muribaculaceae bacterium]|jgi:hypothetical protein|nr:hypothetical protein [Muribaculaceae bacterium]